PTGPRPCPPRRSSDLWVIPADAAHAAGVSAAIRIMRLADVEVHRAEGPFTAAGRSFAAGTYVIPMQQPYAAFAQAMLSEQEYPRSEEHTSELQSRENL